MKTQLYLFHCRDTVLPPEIPLRRHYPPYSDRSHIHHRSRDNVLTRQASQGHQGQSQVAHFYEGRLDSEPNPGNGGKHSGSSVHHRVTASSSLPPNATARFHYERPLRSPLTTKDSPKEASSPVYHQPVKDFGDLHTSSSVAPPSSVSIPSIEATPNKDCPLFYLPRPAKRETPDSYHTCS